MKATLVTALFTIPKRSTPKTELYKVWCRNLAGLDNPIVIYVDDYYFHTFSAARERVDPHHTQTVIYKMELEDMEVHKKYGDSIANVMTSDSFRGRIQFPNVPEMQFSWYNVIMYNKLCFLKEVALGNPFGTDMVCWMDAGGIRNPSKSCHLLKWPNNFNRLSRNKMNMFTVLGRPPFSSWSSDRYTRHCFGQWRYIQGRCFMGDKQSVLRLNSEFFETLEWLMSKQILGSDEKILDFCFAQKPELFNLVSTTPPEQWSQFFDILL